MRSDAVLFDLDGTLVDTLVDIAGAMNHVLDAAGFPTHPLAAYRGFVGHGVRELAARALPDDAADQAELTADAFLTRYDAHLLDATRPYDGATAFLHGLAATGTILAVLSNKPDAQTRRIVETLFPDVPFRIVRGQRPEVPAKPDPQSALLIADALGVAPDRCTFVGDSTVDIETAKNAGMCCAAVTWGFADRAVLEITWPRVLVDTWKHLADLLGVRWPPPSNA